MKMLTRMLAVTVIATVMMGCYSRKERIVERERDRDTERPVVRERVVEQPSSTTTIIK
jgi:hypothetical protein